MEYLIDKFNKEFKVIERDSFFTLFSLLSSIVFYSKTSRLHSELLKEKVIDYHSFDTLKCQYYSPNYNAKGHISLNEELTISQLINFIKQGLLLKIESGKGLYKDNFSSVIRLSKDLDFHVFLDINNITIIIEMFLTCFTEIHLNLGELSNKYNNLKNKISKHDYRSNAVKGSSYYFQLEDYFITSEKKQIIKIKAVRSWSDNDSSESLNIEVNNLEAVIDNEETGNTFLSLLRTKEEKGNTENITS